MKTEELRKQIFESYLRQWTHQTWVWNEDGSVDVDGNVNINVPLDKLPFKFGKIDGYFNCDNCKLKTFENFPNVVTAHLSCENNQFTSLEYLDIECLNLWIRNNSELEKYTKKDIRKYCKVNTSGKIYL